MFQENAEHLCYGVVKLVVQGSLLVTVKEARVNVWVVDLLSKNRHVRVLGRVFCVPGMGHIVYKKHGVLVHPDFLQVTQILDLHHS